MLANMATDYDTTIAQSVENEVVATMQQAFDSGWPQ